jgi:hypothetical protein
VWKPENSPEENYQPEVIPLYHVSTTEYLKVKMLTGFNFGKYPFRMA